MDRGEHIRGEEGGVESLLPGLVTQLPLPEGMLGNAGLGLGKRGLLANKGRYCEHGSIVRSSEWTVSFEFPPGIFLRRLLARWIHDFVAMRGSAHPTRLSELPMKNSPESLIRPSPDTAHSLWQGSDEGHVGDRARESADERGDEDGCARHICSRK